MRRRVTGEEILIDQHDCSLSREHKKEKQSTEKTGEREKERRSGERARARGNYVRAHCELISSRVLLQVSGNLTSRDVNT